MLTSSGSSAAAAGTAAVLGRHADVVCRHEQLNVALQTNNGKLSQRDKQLFHAGVQNDVVTEQAAQRFRYLAQITAAAAPALRLHNLGGQHQRVKCFCLCRRLFPVRQSPADGGARPARLQTAPARQSPIPAAHAHTNPAAAAPASFPPSNQPRCFYD